MWDYCARFAPRAVRFEGFDLSVQRVRLDAAAGTLGCERPRQLLHGVRALGVEAVAALDVVGELR